MIKKYLTMVNQGRKFRDKFMLIIFLPFSQILKSLKKIKLNISVKNTDGIFFCKNIKQFFMYSITREYKLRDYLKLNKNGIFIDAGANIGKYSILIGNKYPLAKIVAIEPDINACSFFKKNMKLNKLKNIKIIRKPVSSKSGRIKFYFDPKTSTKNSMKKEEILRNLDFNDLQRKIKYKWMTTTTIDNILKRYETKNVELIKIDVQGAELAVLKGAENTLTKFKPNIIFEAWDINSLNKISNFLTQMNYVITKIDKNNYFAEYI